jgi:hypothetical protein
MGRFWRCAGLILAAALLAPPAWAEVTPDQAAALEADLRAWVGGLLGPMLDPARLPLHVAADGDGYRLALDPAVLDGTPVTVSGDTDVHLQSLADGLWRLDDAHLPESLTVAAAPGAAPTFSLSAAARRLRADVDPSEQRASTAEFGFDAQTLRTTTPQGDSETRIGRGAYAVTWQRTGDGRTSGSSHFDLSGYAQHQAMAQGIDFNLSADSITGRAKVESIDLPGLLALLRQAGGLPKGPQPPGGPTPAQRALLHTGLATLAGLFTAVDGEQTWTGLHVHSGAVEGGLTRLRVSSALAAPAGLAELRLTLEAEGLDAPTLPAGAARDLVPRHLLLAPHLSGLPKAALFDLLDRQIDAKAPPGDFNREATEMLAEHPLDIVIDALAVDFTQARLTATGALHIAAPDAMLGTAELRMTGLDALIRQVGQVPETRAVTPVLVLLKGLGELNGNETVWRIAYAGRKLTINGVDASALRPGAH